VARIAVIIPTHDRREMVAEAVASVLAQSCADHELVVVDDGSADGTAAALGERFGRRLRLIATPHRGVSSARNTGVRATDSEFIAFLDSDDLWRPGKLAAQLAWFAAHPGEAACQTEEIWLRNGVRVNPRAHHRKPAGDVFIPSLALCLVSPSAVMLQREIFEAAGGFDETLPACEDYDLWLRLACDHHVGLLPEPLVVKRGGHADQLSRRYWGMDRFRVQTLRKLLDRPLAPDRRAAVRDTLQRKCAVLAAGAGKRGRLDEARGYRALAEGVAP
jgi:glycosyltransferase involved in cell wall biosynthesis